MPYHVYVVQCDNDTFYTGYSKNVDKRMKLHLKGKGARYLRIHKPKRLIYVKAFDSRVEAMRGERKIKLLSHSQKLSLIESQSRSRRRKAQISKSRKKAKKT